MWDVFAFVSYHVYQVIQQLNNVIQNDPISWY